MSENYSQAVQQLDNVVNKSNFIDVHLRRMNLSINLMNVITNLRAND